MYASAALADWLDMLPGCATMTKPQDKIVVAFAGHGESSGSYEYLVYRSVLEGVANKHGFESMTDYDDANLEQLFEPVSFQHCQREGS